jgi:uncharacterized protein YwgA/O-acetyl-ADP-ribose deacetylase (regulator of RNase III)
MVKVLVGDLFASNAQTLVNTVNCVGVMGKGIALEFKKRFPDMFEDYLARCQRGEVKLGRPYLYRSLIPPWIVNFPTKDHWRSLTKVDDIISGLEYLLQNYKQWGITSLAVPPLGAGLGQLEWRIVGPVLYRYLEKMDIPVELYAPYGTPTDELELSFLIGGNYPQQLALKPPAATWVKPAWVALVDSVRRVEKQPYHWPVGRTSFQKMAYIASAEGLPLGLEFGRGSYGPYSSGLKTMMSRLLNNGLIREEREGNMFRILVGPMFEAAYAMFLAEVKHWEPIIEKVTDLFMRVDTQQAEIIATVVYAAKELQMATSEVPTEREVLEAVMQWKQRRRPPLNKDEVASTVRNLAALNWLDVKPSYDLPLPQDALLDM